jgi:glycerol-3-phosphate dehydrogenase (NAD(P)+)
MTKTKVAILGAGAMGSALATPLRRNGHEVALWGTHLDDHLIGACREGRPHPRTGVPLAEGTQLYDSGSLQQSLNGAEAIVIAVASQGVETVLRLAAPYLRGTETLLLTSKGFSTAVLKDHGKDLPLIAVAGPCKANEVAGGRPTATCFASTDITLAQRWGNVFRTHDYQPVSSADERGVEVCAAMKNVYAISLGFAEGLSSDGGEPWHNLQAALFAQAVKEMGYIAGLSGGEVDTAFGLAGVGDLKVTGLSGRNKVYGSRLGSGEAAHDALTSMQAAEQTVEGVPASGLGSRYAQQLGADMDTDLPLLKAVDRLVAGRPSPLTALKAAALSI